MKNRNVRTLLAVALVVGLTSCTAMTGKTAGDNIDDAAITASVKTKLVTDRIRTLTSVDVDTVKGTVYLTGAVPDKAAKDRAGELAQQVSGVVDVVNELQTNARAAGDAPSGGHHAVHESEHDGDN